MAVIVVVRVMTLVRIFLVVAMMVVVAVEVVVVAVVVVVVVTVVAVANVAKTKTNAPQTAAELVHQKLEATPAPNAILPKPERVLLDLAASLHCTWPWR